MRWDDFRRSDNVEDDRSGGGGGGGISMGQGGLGIGTVIVLGLIGWALGIDPSVLIGGAEIVSGGGSSYQQPQPTQRPAHQSAEGSVGRFRCCSPWQYGGYLEPNFSG